jgi:iron-sulfur cluster repair protein YtfE (RIC family)
MVRDRSLIPLSHTHHHALALCVQIRRGLSGGSAASAVLGLADSVVSHFQTEMREHFHCEETIVFPALSCIEDLRPVIAELLHEHRELAAMVEHLRSEPDVQRLEVFAEMLTQHVRKEERILFEQAQRLLSREDLDRIGSAVLAAGHRIG